MKQLCEELQSEFNDFAMCTIAPSLESIYIGSKRQFSFFTELDILKITQYCLNHNLGFYFDCNPGRIVVYYGTV